MMKFGKIKETALTLSLDQLPGDVIKFYLNS